VAAMIHELSEALIGEVVDMEAQRSPEPRLRGNGSTAAADHLRPTAHTRAIGKNRYALAFRQSLAESIPRNSAPKAPSERSAWPDYRQSIYKEMPSSLLHWEDVASSLVAS
jgi:hypothetical protein